LAADILVLILFTSFFILVSCAISIILYLKREFK
jgi:hypothetical protein